jgi:hypothetical protein
MTKKFWCHYIGSDGNTPKRRNIELTNLADLIPAIGDNTNCATPLWYEREEDRYNQVYYRLYAQLSENVAVYIIQAGLSAFALERVVKTDEQIAAEWQKWKEDQWNRYQKNDIGKAKDEEFVKERTTQEREERDRTIEAIKQLMGYTNYLLDGNSWISAFIVKAYEEVLSPYLPVLQEMRRKALEERERREQERREENRRRAEKEARRKAEEEAKEQERLTQEAEKFKQGESISGSDVVDLCRRYGIAIHLRTVHNLQQVIADINGKEETCQYYRTRGKRRPQLDGCYKTARELYDYLQAH